MPSPAPVPTDRGSSSRKSDLELKKIALAAGLCLLLSSGCGDNLRQERVSGSTCQEAVCGAQSQKELLADIAGFSDPFSVFLRENMDGSGAIAGDYQSLLTGMAALQGCALQEAASFVVLSNHGYFPRTIFTNCSGTPQKASRFFLLAPIVGEGPDIEPQELHLSAWDEESGRYRHFATNADATGKMRITTQPAYCLGCHGGSKPLPHWQPLMNEMRNPWSQWNAKPAFQSHLFDEYLDEDFQTAPVFQSMLQEIPLRPAADLEGAVRAGIARFVRARTALRTSAAKVEEALRLLRPVFCDETVNYVSEIHRSGEISSAVLLDDGLRNALASMRPGKWDFGSETSFLLPPPGASEERVIMMPIRGESTVLAEASLLPRKVLALEDVMRVRLLDYDRPMASSFRCSLYTEGAERIEAGELATQMAELGDGGSNADFVALFYTEMMHKVQEDGLRRSLLVATDNEYFLAIADISSAKGQAFLQEGALADLVQSVDDVGDRVQLRLQNASRQQLLQLRDSRACLAQTWFAGSPAIPGLHCP